MSDSPTPPNDDTSLAREPTTYAPVYLTVPDGSGYGDARSLIGRRPVLDSDEAETTDYTLTLDDHALFSGLPRTGKTSPLQNVARALHEDHDYSYLHLFDDGRNEAAMSSLPATNPGIVDTLDDFDMEPTGMDMEVFIPATESMPDYLPSNFTPFTLSHTDVPDAYRDTATWDVLSEAGIISESGADTNIAIEEVVADNDRAASLFLDSDALPSDVSAGRVRIALADVWLESIYRARDQDPRLPRVTVALDGLRIAAPHRLDDHHPCPDVTRSLRETVYKTLVQGGSRRVSLLAATSDFTELYKPVRENFSSRFIFRSSVSSLDAGTVLPDATKHQIKNLESGTAAVTVDRGTVWPVDLAPAPFSIGDADNHWRDDYGRAAGARIGQATYPDGHPVRDADWWIDVAETEVTRDRLPEVGEWFLLPQDFDTDDPPLSMRVDEDGEKTQFLEREIVEDTLRWGRSEDASDCYPLVATEELVGRVAKR